MRLVPACVTLAIGSVAGVASAANGSKPRVPVAWSEGACATIVDRASTPVLHLEYGVAVDDLGPLSEDEVDDSRTHQFFAFARLDYAAVGTAQRLPPWITRDDIDRAALVDPQVVPSQITDFDVLESTSRFAAADWLRITDDDARRPISAAQAALGVDWDLALVEPGVYTVWGYTWEPLVNLWAQRPGFVKVIDGPQGADAAGPGIALSVDNATVVPGEPYEVQGCADAPAGSTITLEWGVVQGPDEPEWATLLVDEPIESGPLALEMVLPDEAAGEGPGLTLVRLRATITAPSGDSFVAHSPGSYAVEPRDEMSEAAGCACASDPAARGSWALLLLGLSCSRRRCTTSRTRRRTPACSCRRCT